MILKTSLAGELLVATGITKILAMGKSNDVNRIDFFYCGHGARGRGKKLSAPLWFGRILSDLVMNHCVF